jgi:3-hydroxyisobutyrate dehydrogenase-like beta-hydroxyacid dehydrogenase
MIGLGNLGLPMTEALLGAGVPVVVYDRRPDAMSVCAHRGARAATSLGELARCSVIAVVVSDDRAVWEVVVESGLVDQLGSGAVVVVHSTILPATAQRLARRAEEADVALVDAPVSGGAERARSGDLTVFAGGDRAAVDALDAYMRVVASSVVHLGPTGAGSAGKLANQLMMFAALASSYEALELAEAYGVAEDGLLEAVAASTGDSWVVRNWGFFDQTADAYDRSGVPVNARPWSKDLLEVVAAARERDIVLPVARFLADLVPDRVEAHARARRERS